MMYLKIRGLLCKDRIEASFFMGPLPARRRVYNGHLRFSIGAWQLFASALSLGAEHMEGHLTVEIIDPLAKAEEIDYARHPRHTP